MTEKLGWVAGTPNDEFQGVILSIQWLKRDHSWEFGSGMVENPHNSSAKTGPMLLDLTGKKILVTGIANNRSIAWGIAQQLKAAGAELGITYLPDDKGRFETKVRELTAPLEPSCFCH